MRAAIFRKGELVVDTVPDPVLAEGQVLVRTRACGICGTDLHAARFPAEFTELARRTGGRWNFDPDRDVVFGHEYVAEVVASGPGTEGRFRPGQLVTSMPLTIAGTTVLGLGYNPDVPGAFAEYMPLAERMLLPVPEGMDADHAALTEPMAVGVHAVNLARLTEQDVPLVIGCGPIGLAVIAALKLHKVRPDHRRGLLAGPPRAGAARWAPTSSSIRRRPRPMPRWSRRSRRRASTAAATPRCSASGRGRALPCCSNASACPA